MRKLVLLFLVWIIAMLCLFCFKSLQNVNTGDESPEAASVTSNQVPSRRPAGVDHGASQQTSVAANNNATSPAGVSPDSSSQASKSTSDYSQYSPFIVTIEGDKSIGTGFLVKMGAWNCVATNAHVLNGNKVLKIRTINGRVLEAKQLAVAKNIDLALIAVDYTGPFLPVCKSFPDKVHINDPIVVLGNSEGAGVLTDLMGTIQSIGPDRIEVDAKFVEGNSGSPVIQTTSGEAIGIATYYLSANLNEFGKGSAAVKDSPFWTIRRFAYRLDAAQGFDYLTLEKFSEEAGWIDQFNETTENIYLLAADLAFTGAIHLDWHHRRMDRLALPVQDYIEKTSRSAQKLTHDSMDPRQEFLTRLDYECTADINLYKRSFVSSYHTKMLGDIASERQQLKHLIQRLLTQ